MSKRLGKASIFYIFCSAGTWNGRRLAVRWIVGAWCLAALVLSNIYTCLVTSFLTEPIQHPLIHSIYDLRDRPGIRLVTERGGNVDATLLVRHKSI